MLIFLPSSTAQAAAYRKENTARDANHTQSKRLGEPSALHKSLFLRKNMRRFSLMTSLAATETSEHAVFTVFC